MTQVKTKFDANTNPSKIIRTFRHFGKLFRRMVIWIQCFHRPNITTCGKYLCACVMPERYFLFTCCGANISITASTGKRKTFDPCACACACACITSENQAGLLDSWTPSDVFRINENFIQQVSPMFICRHGKVQVASLLTKLRNAIFTA